MCPAPNINKYMCLKAVLGPVNMFSPLHSSICICKFVQVRFKAVGTSRQCTGDTFTTYSLDLRNQLEDISWPLLWFATPSSFPRIGHQLRLHKRAHDLSYHWQGKFYTNFCRSKLKTHDNLMKRLPETSIKHPGARRHFVHMWLVHMDFVQHTNIWYSIGPWRKTKLLSNGATPIQQPNCSFTIRWMVQKWSERCIKSLQRNTMSSKICTTSHKFDVNNPTCSIHDSQNWFWRFLVTMWKCLMYPKYL